ncbi:phytoene desaturase family protein [Rhabdothermincola salaria]|uniref:phytoene desaturase family protein n=1 Tax=Rhabdothermincola salaria TaxID=2903142 RepID=UPI001E3A8067|nr:phytoene desaturase family protein [Rhabdothermincola salaria]MCD9625332.1 phytoene desaturase family protein [Rhabdothermincola salaria]
MRVVVVGAGLAGLSAACHLRGAGHDVLVVERDAGPGGRAHDLRLEGYRFDAGPTVFTMPELVDDCFRALGAEPRAYLEVRPVDPLYRTTFDDGSVLHVRAGREAMAAEIASVCGPAEAAAFHRFADWLGELYALEMPNFIDRNFDSPLDLAWPLGPALHLLRLGGLRKLSTKVASYFADERLHKVFGFQSLYAGLAPYEALAVYCIITYMDSIAGVYHPVGGMQAVPASMARALTDHGVEFRYDTPIDRILLAEGTSGRVLGVRTDDGEVIGADAVVCNPDLPVAYRTLLPGTPMPRVARRGSYSPSCLLWHVGVKGRPAPEVAHHNIHFGGDWHGAFRALLHDGVRMPDPSLLVSVPTVDEPGMAPDGDSVLYVLEPCPNLDGRVDWTRERGRARDSLARRIEELGYPTDIVVEHFVDPLDWERQGMERGTPFALAHDFFQSGPFRPNNVTRHAPGLVFAGSGTVPGVGVPMVLVSGRLAAERVSRLS